MSSCASEHSFKPRLVDVRLNLMRDGIAVAGSMVVNLACDQVYGTSNGDWSKSTLSVSSGGTVSIIAQKACRISLVSYDDGTFVYTQASSSLTLNISSSGSVTQTSALQYTSGGPSPLKQWFAGTQGGSPFTVIINYAADAIAANNSPSIINLLGQAVSLTAGLVAAPTLSSLNLYFIPGINSAAALYTLTASVSGATSCKYIDNSAATYTPTLWLSVNSAFNAAQAFACPTFIDGQAGFTLGNWTSRWAAGLKTLVIWANTVNGMSSYTTANIGP